MSFCLLFFFFCAAAQDPLLLLLLLLLLQSNASIIAISTCQEITSDLTLQQRCYLHISLPGNFMLCRIPYTGLLVLVFLGMGSKPNRSAKESVIQEDN